MTVATVLLVPVYVVAYTPSGLLQMQTSKTFLNPADAAAFVVATSGATLQPGLGLTLYQAGATTLGQVYLLSSTPTSLSGTLTYAPSAVA